MSASREELAEAEEVGSKIADSIVDYFSDQTNRDIIERLRSAGLQFEAIQRKQDSTSLSGKSIVISGKFVGRSRDDMKAIVEAHGGRNIAAVSANVDFIVAGENMGPAKRQKAEKLGIKILSEEEFFAMIQDEESSAETDTGAPINEDTDTDTAIDTTSIADTESPAASQTAVQGTLF